MELQPMEEAVINKLLDGELPALIALRQQIPHLFVKTRELTGVGFFTDFGAPPDAVPAPVGEKIRFGDVEAKIPGLQHGAGFVLYIDGGLIQRLEGYTYDEPWPERVDGFALKYSDPDRKELLKVFG